MIAVNCKHAQRGQAMIEYALIMMLMVMLIIGGMELARTSFASSKVGDAAKAAANELAEIHKKDDFGIYKLIELQKEYVVQLDAQFGRREVDADGKYIVAAVTYSAFEVSAVTVAFPDYLAFLNQLDVDGVRVFDVDSFEAYLLELYTSGAISLSNPDTILDGDLDSAELAAAYTSVQLLSNSVAKYRALTLIRQLQIINLSPVLADHEDATITRANCGAGNTYDYGLPNRYPNGDAVYLFHPLPVNTINCIGEDPTRANKSKISILVGGYGQPGDAGYVQGLPKLNQAMYSLYTKVCLTAADQYVSCSQAHTQELLKPPGKICLTNSASNTIDSCGTEGPPVPLTGYYFWGQDNDADAGSFAYENDDTLTFRPTFQVVCNAESFQSPDNTNDACLTNDGLQKIQIHTRYRSIFEGFLTFGLQELGENFLDVLPYFYNPGRTGTDNQIGGIAGAEIGPIGNNLRPTVKQFKDFRGCYEVDVETNQISACN
jgi:Flp pilus assembly pilin Flp